jgi:hypothetical protein
MPYKKRLESLYKFNKIGDVKIESLKKYIEHVIQIDTFSRKYDFNTRYLEQADQLPSRWSKSWFRDSFAKSKGKTADLPFIKVDECFLRNDNDFVLCLDEDPRISAEISHGSLDYKAVSQFTESDEKLNYIINDGIVIPHVSTYNIWHHFVELISITNEIVKNKNLKLDKFIFIPEMKDTKELLHLLSIEDRVKTFPINKNMLLTNSYIVTGVFDEILPIKCLRDSINQIVGSDKIKNNQFNIESIFLSRGDKELNRRNLMNEEDTVSTLKKKFPNLEINKPGLVSLKDNISKMVNAKYAISLQGTQLYFNCLFMKKPKIIWELVSDNYYGLTVGELAANFLNCKYMSSPTKSIEPGYAIYKDQIVNIDSLKSSLDGLEI